MATRAWHRPCPTVSMPQTAPPTSSNRVCAWCRRLLAKPTLSEALLDDTHTICETCRERYFPEEAACLQADAAMVRARPARTR